MGRRAKRPARPRSRLARPALSAFPPLGENPRTHEFPLHAAMPDPERIVALAYDEAWAEAWAIVHDAAESIETDRRLSWAASTLTDATFRRLQKEAVTPDLADSLERLILLHSGGLYHVSGDRFQTAVARLVGFHRKQDNLEDARHYARFCPT